jgi:hypothetical protein
VGETQNQPFQLSFNASSRVDIQGSRVPSERGLILIRKLDEWLDFWLIKRYLTDARGKNAQLSLLTCYGCRHIAAWRSMKM